MEVKRRKIMEQRKRRKESGERVGKNREWGGENVREVKFIQGESGKSGGKKFKFFTESGGYVWRMNPYATNMCGVWIHTPQTCLGKLWRMDPYATKKAHAPQKI